MEFVDSALMQGGSVIVAEAGAFVRPRDQKPVLLLREPEPASPQLNTGRVSGLGAGEQARSMPEVCTLAMLFDIWDRAKDESTPASAYGVVYHARRGSAVAELVAKDSRHTDQQFRALKLVLKPGELLLSVASGFRYRTERDSYPDAPLEAIIPHVLWVIEYGAVHKVRQPHQHQYRQRRFCSDPYMLEPNYQPVGTTLSYPFIEQADVVPKLEAHGIQVPEPRADRFARK